MTESLEFNPSPKSQHIVAISNKEAFRFYWITSDMAYFYITECFANTFGPAVKPHDDSFCDIEEAKAKCEELEQAI